MGVTKLELGNEGKKLTMNGMMASPIRKGAEQETAKSHRQDQATARLGLEGLKLQQQ